MALQPAVHHLPMHPQSPFALWTAQAVRGLIHQKFGKTLGLSTMQLYLKRWGFPRRSLRAERRSDPQKIAAWLEQDYPSIAARAKREKAVIYWGDETGVGNQDQISCPHATPNLVRLLPKAGSSSLRWKH